MVQHDDHNEPTALDVAHVSIKKGEHLVLKECSFSLERGRFAALVGPSGSGKTSLLRVLALLDRPAHGTISFFGSPAYERGDTWFIKGRALYPSVTYVPQTLAMWPHMTLRENMMFSIKKASDVAKKLDYFSSRLGLTGLLDRKPQYVSQGQKQRCALVRALLLNPMVLLLDEITAALDEDLASDVWRLLLSLARQGCAIIASTHSGTLALQCDYRFRIRNQAISVEPQRDEAI
jgi:ABC-type multidrug transport system ATPase subunit